jgi:hypothetical protein
MDSKPVTWTPKDRRLKRNQVTPPKTTPTPKKGS